MQTYARNAEGEEFYPRRKNGFPFYPLDNLGNEMYLLSHYGTQITLGKHLLLQHEIYAKNAQGDYFYPHTKRYAKTNKSLTYYATARDGRIIFQRNDWGDEEYLESPNGTFQPLKSVPSEVKKNVKLRYVQKANGREIYPYETGNRTVEEVEFNKHALDENDKPYYPLDRYENEYVFPFNPYQRDIPDILPRSYPISLSGFFFVPSYKDEPIFLPDTNITVDNVIGKLTFSRPTYF